MNEMYALSQDIHIYTLMGWLFVLLTMIVVHKWANDFDKLVKSISVLMILHITLASAMVLTGAIMMAVRHLSLTPANLLMILAILVVATLEIKRNKALGKVVKFKLMPKMSYIHLALKYQISEFVIIVAVGVFSGMARAISF